MSRPRPGAIWHRHRRTDRVALVGGGDTCTLSADEAYYWLWSRHLAAGYYDHPPAIAWVVRAGTLIFGATPLGVRIGGIVLSILATTFVWRTGAILLRDETQGARAALFFNLTLMISVETLAATPDAPAVATATAVLYALAKVVQSGRRDAGGSPSASRPASACCRNTPRFFLGTGIAVWLLLSPAARRWLLTPWPYARRRARASLIFLPNLLWQASHGWMTFAFQFGRIAGGSFTLRFLFEFLGAQLLLASPFLFVLAALALAFERRGRDSAVFLLAAIVFPSALYFLIHSLHDRIQGNWPSFLYPALAIAAGAGLAHAATGPDGPRRPGEFRAASRRRSRPCCCWRSMRRRCSVSCRSGAAIPWRACWPSAWAA